MLNHPCFPGIKSNTWWYEISFASILFRYYKNLFSWNWIILFSVLILFDFSISVKTLMCSAYLFCLQFETVGIGQEWSLPLRADKNCLQNHQASGRESLDQQAPHTMGLALVPPSCRMPLAFFTTQEPSRSIGFRPTYYLRVCSLYVVFWPSLFWPVF